MDADKEKERPTSLITKKRQVQGMLKKYKEDHWKNRIKKAQKILQHFWKLLKAMGRQRSRNAPLKTCEGFVFKDVEKAETAAKFDQEQFSNKQAISRSKVEIERMVLDNGAPQIFKV